MLQECFEYSKKEWDNVLYSYELLIEINIRRGAGLDESAANLHT